ncbi:MAG: substrate-binding domain-containing protein [Candidatus Nanopelagicales bacterium]|nr:substrate-binding domain-containing protein [Candidatus Nanopelagicales bacterium]
MMIKRFGRTAAVVAMGSAMALGLVACSSDSSTEESTDAATAEEAAAEGAAAEEAASGEAGGSVAVITVDPSNPYWKAEVDTAVAELGALGYESTVNAHGNDPDKQNQFIDAAIAAGAKAIILDPAGADESVGAVQKATDAGIPVFQVNAEISEQGIAKAQIVSNNAQGAALGAEAWVECMGDNLDYVELFGNPTDNNAGIRSTSYHEVIDPLGFNMLQQETANWDRQEGKQKMELMIQAQPDLKGVIAGNDEMALGAIEALREAGKLQGTCVLGFDGNDDAVAAVAAGEMVATVPQPIVNGTKTAVAQLNEYLTTGTAPAQEKQSIDCILITPENAGKVQGFTLSE